MVGGNNVRSEFEKQFIYGEKAERVAEEESSEKKKYYYELYSTLDTPDKVAYSLFNDNRYVCMIQGERKKLDNSEMEISVNTKRTIDEFQKAPGKDLIAIQDAIQYLEELQKRDET